MTSMTELRQVTNPGGITGTNPDDRDRMVHLPKGTALVVLKEMGSMVKVGVRVNAKRGTSRIMELFVRYQIVWTFTRELERAA